MNPRMFSVMVATCFSLAIASIDGECGTDGSNECKKGDSVFQVANVRQRTQANTGADDGTRTNVNMAEDADGVSDTYQYLQLDQCNLQEQQSKEPPASFENFDHGSGYEGLYVNQDANFAMCLIEKNACSAWTAIMGKLQDGNLDNNAARYGIAQRSFTAAGASKVFNDPDSVRAVFVRDPLERFLSAFLSKCADASCKNQFCFMRKMSQLGEAIPFSQAVEWALTQDLTHVDGHFRLQSRHCELHNRLHEYSVIGVMQSDTLAEDASCMLSRANLSHVNYNSHTKTAPFWKVGHHRNRSENVEFLQSFYDQEAANAMYNLLKEDYETFKMPKPSWIDSAHGKILNAHPPKACNSENPNQAGNPQNVLLEVAERKFADSIDHTSEDDISSLARMAGFTL